MTKELNVGLIGLGFIGKVHTVAYRNLALCFSHTPVVPDLAAVLRTRLDTEIEAMKSFRLTTTDADEFYAQGLDIVDVCTPNCLHREQVERALRSGAAVYCEKPLTCTLEDAQAMTDLAEATGALTQVAFMMRYIPAVRHMKTIIDSGRIGDVYHFRARCFHGSYLNPGRPISWRLRIAQAGGGAFMDLGVHMVDMTRYLLGKVVQVRAVMRTFIDERFTARGSDRPARVDVDDWALCTLELASRATGVIEVTRMAAGSGHTADFEVYGSKGAVIFRMSDLDSAHVYDLARERWTSTSAELPPPAGERPTDQVWPSGKYFQGWMTSAHMAAAHDFLLNVAEGKPSPISFRAGAAAQEIVEAAYSSAARGGELITLPLHHKQRDPDGPTRPPTLDTKVS